MKEDDHIKALMRSRSKLVEQRRAVVKRDCSTDRNEGYAERIVSIQAAIEATDRAISDEQKLLIQKGEDSAPCRTGSVAAA